MPVGFVDLAQTRIICEKETLIEKTLVGKSGGYFLNQQLMEEGPTTAGGTTTLVLGYYHLRLSQPWRVSHQAALPHDLCCGSFPSQVLLFMADHKV